MLLGFLKGGSLAFLLFGLYNMLTGNAPAGAVYLVAGSIMDLQARSMEQDLRLKALENKEKKNAVEPT